MKTVFLFLGFLFLGFWAKAQVVENFSDGDFTQNPPWLGTTDAWVVSNAMLRSSSTNMVSPFYISTASTQTSGLWRTYFRYAFLPTSGNNSEFWVMSDSANLASAKNGYFVRIGDTNKDICLYKSINGVATKIIDGPDQLIAGSSNSGIIRLTRTAGGQFALWAININASTDSVLIGTVTDNEINAGTRLGFLVKSTPSNSGKHYYDDILAIGPAFPDLIPPTLLSASLVSPSEIDLVFDEPLEETFAENPSKYSLSPFISIFSATLATNQKTVRLLLGQTLTSGVQYFATAIQSKDLVGNIQTHSQAKNVTYLPDVPYRTIVINEIMAAPNSSAGTTVPQVEWVELHNPGNTPVTINGWTIRDASTSPPKLIPTTTIPANGFAILTSVANVSLFPGLITAGLPLPALNNDQDSLVISDSNGNPVDVVHYFDGWYRDNVKKQGGYSLEQINPMVKCTVPGNWIGSNVPSGGSPGGINTAYSTTYDNTPPNFLNVVPQADTILDLVFSESLDPEFSALDQLYSIQPGNLVVTSLGLVGDLSIVRLKLSAPLTIGNSYSLTVQQSKDLFCNVQSLQEKTFIFTLVPVQKSVKPELSWFAIPNPATETIRLSQIPQAHHMVEILNGLGQVILSQTAFKEQTISIHQFPVGVYQFRVLGTSGNLVGRGIFVKN